MTLAIPCPRFPTPTIIIPAPRCGRCGKRTRPTTWAEKVRYMAGGAWVQGGGKFVVNSDGKLYVCSDCPCPAGCGHCNAPATVTATFAGLSVCATCLSGSGQSVENIDLVPWNGTYNVPTSSGPCSYRLITTFGGGSWRRFLVEGCTGTPFETNEMENLNISISLHDEPAGTVKLIILSSLRSSDGVGSVGGFQAVVPGIACENLNGYVASNVVVCGFSGAQSSEFITGGTCTLSW